VWIQHWIGSYFLNFFNFFKAFIYCFLCISISLLSVISSFLRMVAGSVVMIRKVMMLGILGALLGFLVTRSFFMADWS
jgi:hypothetical protein